MVVLNKFNEEVIGQLSELKEDGYFAYLSTPFFMTNVGKVSLHTLFVDTKVINPEKEEKEKIDREFFQKFMRMKVNTGKRGHVPKLDTFTDHFDERDRKPIDVHTFRKKKEEERKKKEEERKKKEEKKEE